MKSLFLIMAALSLGACSSLAALAGATAPAGHQQTLEALGEHISGCDRHYQGGFGLGASFTFNIDCKAQPNPKD